MPSDDIKVTGLQELNKVLDQIPEKLQKKYLRKSLAELARDLMIQLKAKVSRSEAHKITKSAPLPLWQSIELGGSGGSKGWVRRKIKSNYYARFLEFGTVRMSARPFVRPTVDSVGDQKVQQVCDNLARQISLEDFKG